MSEHPEDDPALLEALDTVIDGYGSEKGVLIPALQSAQNLYGFLPEKVLKHISKKLNIPYSEVAGVVTFYSYFSTVPRGKYLVRVCLGTACYVRGGKEVLAAIKDYLGIDVGETTQDRKFSLEIGRCFGACSLAPVIMVNDTVHQRVKPERLKELLAPYENDEVEANEGSGEETTGGSV
ncbi:MAG: NAD(P)H-dependent oxidoreductase subunit E [Spirochaetales bacterium]|nr:NAD(P)H-dependent oxidoreductase subunit E [Spirochaetales bacterium]MCF7938524.1 NAD(P)H-dependent oxidoreductase subunit E [Spirochaetales bacterium]